MESSQRQRGDVSGAADPAGDQALLRAVARERDQKAFARLYERYERPAYRLALHLTGNRELASEAVQEAMLSIWRMANRFEGEKPRAWIFRIIANRSLNITEKEISASRRNRIRQEPPPQNVSEDPRETVVQREIERALASQFSKLPPRDRQLLALHYCCGLNQTQIAGLLAMPPRTVSAGLESALKRLRAGMLAAGQGPALALGAPLFLTLLEEGALPPASLRPAVLEAVKDAGLVHSRDAFAFVLSRKGRVAAGLLGSSLLAVAAYALRVQGPQGSSPVLTAQEAATAAQADLIRRWTFETGLPQDIELLSSSWIWEAPKNGRPGQAISKPGEQVYVALPPLALPKQFVVSLKARPIKFDGGPQRAGNDWAGCAASWMEDDRLLPVRGAPLSASAAVQPGELLAARWYFLESYILSEINGLKTEVSCITEMAKKRRIWLAISNLAIEEFALRGIGDEDIPAAYRDPEALLRAQGGGLTRRGMGLLPLSLPRTFPNLDEETPRVLFDFSRDNPSLFRPLQGRWDWDQATGTARVERPSKFLVPLVLPQRPFVITILQRHQAAVQHATFELTPIADRMVIRRTSWKKRAQVDSGSDFTLRLYVLPPFVLGYAGDRLGFVEKHHPGQRMNCCVLTLENVLLQSIEFRLLNGGEIPPALRDPQALAESLGVEGTPVRGTLRLDKGSE